MKDTLRRIVLISKLYKLDQLDQYFYAMDINKYTITFYGEYNSFIAKKLNELNFEVELDSNGYMQFRRDSKYVVVLTDNI